MIKEKVKEKIKNILISPNDTIRNALERMDKFDRKLLIVSDGERFIGLLSIGDIQRAILKNKPLDYPVKKVIRRNIRVGTTNQKYSDIKKIILKERIECMPILDLNGNLVEVFFWEEVIGLDKKSSQKLKSIPVVILAGGIGSRLKPLTNVLPKPLIPLKENPIIIDIMDSFHKEGVNEFFISLNYKADLVKYYFSDKKLSYKIKFIQEKYPGGSAGSLSLLKNKIEGHFFVTNCDIMINQEYSEVYEYHKLNKNDITIVTSIKNIPIPYGIVNTGKNGIVTDIKEKPEISLHINTGMYILDSKLLAEIPAKRVFHMTDLITKLKKKKYKLGYFPISEGSLIDIGNWSEYKKFIIGL